jgi:hypothetical protein
MPIWGAGHFSGISKGVNGHFSGNFSGHFYSSKYFLPLPSKPPLELET